ncbi:MAG: hypothetical protein AB7R55_14720 [Gemmatimonadales bacterium]
MSAGAFPVDEIFAPLDRRPGELGALIREQAERHAARVGLTVEEAVDLYHRALRHAVESLGPDALPRALARSTPQGDSATLARSEREALERLVRPEAADTMAAEVSRWPGRELAFWLARHDDGRYHLPCLFARGAADRVLGPPAFPNTLSLHVHPTGDLGPSRADLDAAWGWLRQEGAAFAITDPLVTRAYVVIEPQSSPLESLPGEPIVVGSLPPHPRGSFGEGFTAGPRSYRSFTSDTPCKYETYMTTGEVICEVAPGGADA